MRKIFPKGLSVLATLLLLTNLVLPTGLAFAQEAIVPTEPAQNSAPLQTEQDVSAPLNQ